MEQYSTLDVPDFLVKTSLGVSLVAMCLVIPFCINNFIQGRYLIGLLILFTLILCAINSYLCFKGKYNKKLNFFGIFIFASVSIVYAIYLKGVIGSYWAYLGVLTFYFILPIKLAWKSNVIFVLAILPVAWNSLELDIFARFYAILIGISIHGYEQTTGYAVKLLK